MSGAEPGATGGGVEECERVGLGVHDGVARNGRISGIGCVFRSLDITGKEPVVDLVLDRSVHGGSVADGGGVGPEQTGGRH